MYEIEKTGRSRYKPRPAPRNFIKGSFSENNWTRKFSAIPISILEFENLFIIYKPGILTSVVNFNLIKSTM